MDIFSFTTELQTVLDDERKKKEEIEKNRDELSRKLQEKEAELNNLLKKKLIDLNEKGTTAGQAELTDLNNNELQVSQTMQGLDDFTGEENTRTEEEKVKDIFRKLENHYKEEMQLFGKAKELIENHFEKTSADLEGNSQGTEKRKTHTNQERKSLLKSLERERELVKEKQRLTKKNENLEKKVKTKGNEIEEWKKKLSEVQKKWDQLKEKSDCYSGQIEQLQKDRDKWQTRSKTFEDEIRKSRIFVSSKYQLRFRGERDLLLHQG